MSRPRSHVNLLAPFKETKDWVKRNFSRSPSPRIPEATSDEPAESSTSRAARPISIAGQPIDASADRASPSLAAKPNLVQNTAGDVPVERSASPREQSSRAAETTDSSAGRDPLPPPEPLLLVLETADVSVERSASAHEQVPRAPEGTDDPSVKYVFSSPTDQPNPGPSGYERILPEHRDEPQGDRTLRDQAKDALKTGWKITKVALKLLESVSDPLPPLKAAVAGLNFAIERADMVVDVKADFKALATKIQLFRDILKYHQNGTKLPIRLQSCLDRVVTSMNQLRSSLSEKMKSSGPQKIIEVEENVQDVEDHLKALDSLIDIFMTETTLITGMTVEEMNQVMDALVNDAALRKLNYVADATLGPQECLQGTREKLLDEITQWAKDRNCSQVLWLNGMAGTGKTTVATELFRGGRSLQAQSVLCVGFFCSRQGAAEQGDLRSIFPTLAYGLAYKCPEYLKALIPALANIPHVRSLTLKQQFEQLILKPLQNSDLPSSRSISFLVDGLDEGGEGSGDNTIKMFLEAILNNKLPSFLKFILTSRPELWIERILSNHPEPRVHIIPLHDVETYPVQGDIMKYLRTELSGSSIEEGLLTEERLKLLAAQAGKLFIYASTVCKYICDEYGDAGERLEELTSAPPMSIQFPAIDALYNFILSKAFDRRSRPEQERTQKTLAIIVYARDILSVSAIADLAATTADKIRTTLRPLHTVLQLSGHGDNDCVTTYHASFPDYLTDVRRSDGKQWCLPQSDWNLTKRCFEIMKTDLHFNIYGLTTSHRRNKEQARSFSPAQGLIYACKFWADHIVTSANPLDYATRIHDFLFTYFLFWLEVLSMEHCYSRATSSLVKVSNLTLKSPDLSKLHHFLRDAKEFVVVFMEPITISAPHIYLSALPFAKQDSMVWKTYRPQSPRLFVPRIRGKLSPSVLSLTIADHTGPVNSVAFSVDGTRIVSGSDDKTIRIWDAQTGDLAVGPLEGHTDWVTSVAFSTDGTRIVSGSDDNTIRVWDAQTGDLAVGPLEGHIDRVNSVAFSADGTRIVSGSRDKTIRVWDVQRGETSVQSLQECDPRSQSLGILDTDHSHVVPHSAPATMDIKVCCQSESWSVAWLRYTSIFVRELDNDGLGPGWVYGPNKELIFWVPFANRRGLCYGRKLKVLGAAETTLDLAGFVHGEEWTKCYSPS